MDVICDHSQQNLKVVPLRVLDMSNLQMLYLEGNDLESLPLNIFQRLPKLSWLDIRNNQLREIPVGIANHPCLENLLLEQNALVRLPNELGLVPNLNVLQLAKNPLVYPSKDIISKGTKAITFYLRNEYNKEHDLPLESKETEEAFFRNKENEKVVKKKKRSSKVKADVREMLRKASLHRRLQIENMPSISIKSLSPKSSSNQIKCKESSSEVQHSNRRAHKMTRNQEESLDRQQQREQRIKDLRSRIERDLAREIKTITRRARTKLATGEKPPSPQILEIDKEARATERNYETMPSRRDLASGLEKILKRGKHVPKRKCDLQKLINELISQLKTLEVVNEANHDQNDLQKSEKEIQKIVSLHKKVIELQQKNQSSF
ncbi:hypothetical protein Trydic_g13039 [Trypoxylus dichotomus]